ncbi:MAG: hypothetical protein GTO53_07635 [Planctomycetales bacterium]|nr:hypothetical protein [Planctomycetales bacterium]NIM09008.1 hypothetical protein [Planctomycetales bacterium]NIN08471.1 hypothetical protein [Planctomycetales bacterium]NIN77605.1 hypothetical protein [Planctomycetales bacterium]NIO34770.1 hypothetical protein [Planctomycetales bacterium]
MSSRWPTYLSPTLVAMLALAVCHAAVLHAEDDLLQPASQDEALVPQGESEAAGTENEAVLKGKVEIIRERYPNRAVKVEREVVRDANDNYVNHGIWRMWDENGNMVSKGQYEMGKRTGAWNTWHAARSNKIFQQQPFKEFVGPFSSHANFQGGLLEGTWTIFDGKKRKILEFSYANGVRHGTCTKAYSNGRKLEEIEYKNGEMHGIYRQWTPDGRLVKDQVYDKGRTIIRKVTHYRDAKKKSEGEYLLAKQVLEGKDDWWAVSFASTIKEGEDEKHGEWRTWYPNGQMQVHGFYEHDRPSGELSWSWWYPNGQKAVEGAYDQGQQHGSWTWWHQNGQKKLAGKYAMGEPSGKWIWWKNDGMVLQKMDFSAISRDLVDEDLHDSTADVGGSEPSVLSVPLNTKLPDLHSIKK